MSFDEVTATDQLHMMLLSNNAERGSFYFYVNREFSEMAEIAVMLSELRVIGDLTVKVQPLQSFLASRYRPDNMPAVYFMVDVAQLDRVFATDTVFEVKFANNEELLQSMATVAMTIAEHLEIYDLDRVVLHRNYGEYAPRSVESFGFMTDRAISESVDRLISSVQTETGDTGR